MIDSVDITQIIQETRAKQLLTNPCQEILSIFENQFDIDLSQQSPFPTQKKIYSFLYTLIKGFHVDDKTVFDIRLHHSTPGVIDVFHIDHFNIGLIVTKNDFQWNICQR